ncbi:MAG TPA: EAL domain-containing protein [Luteimonas sp.]|nr:EAL domain-containing protein [Luteimonas sp.]
MNSQSAALKVLMVEDSPADADLILHSLRDLPCPVEHALVASEAALREALASFDPDIILSDFSMPGFSGQEALSIASEHAPDVPFLFVSGTIGEELAIATLQRGAIDYVLKDNLRRLPLAIERALDIARNRRERAQMERALRESEERFRTIVENSQDWIWESDQSTRTLYSNGAIARILGYAPDELLGTLASEHMLPEDRRMMEERLPRLAAEARGWERWRLRWRHRDGSVRVLESTAIPRMDENGEVVGFRSIDHDITEHLQQEAKIAQLARIHAVLSALGSAILRTRERQLLLDRVCRIAVEQGGFKAACIGLATEETGLRLAASHGDPDVIAYIARLSEQPPVRVRTGIRALRGGKPVIVGDIGRSKLEPVLRDALLQVGVAAQVVLPIGTPPWAVLGLFSVAAQEFDKDELGLLVRLAHEIDYAVDFIAKSERLEYLAYHNPVTDLPNQIAFQQEVAARLAQGPLLVAVVELASSGRIIESRGREFGEGVLRMVGQRLQAEVGPSVIVAHPGEYSFLLAKSVLGSVQQEIESLGALLRALDDAPYEIEDEQVFLHLNCGVALSPEHGTDGETLERNATVALGEALKRKTRIEPFNEGLHERATRRIELERDLHRAFAENEFELWYQPKFNAVDQRLLGAEALLRWRHPQAGLVSPAEFIPVLEDTGLIVQAGRWVMRTALDTVLAWRALGHAGLRIAVNVSARELRNLRFLDECRDLLEPHAADQLLDIEVTESLLMDDIEHSIRLLQSLRAMGCRIAIDDFGTGYSSLNYLARLPVDVIKIDQSFTAQLAHSPETMGLITNIISLAHSLSLKVVAEGVEEEEQAKLLRLLRCDELQGYLLGRPMPATQFAERLL